MAERTTVREAIVEVLKRYRRTWMYKSEIGREVSSRFRGTAKNQETIFRELRRLVEEDIVTKYERGKYALYALKSRLGPKNEDRENAV